MITSAMKFRSSRKRSLKILMKSQDSENCRSIEKEKTEIRLRELELLIMMCLRLMREALNFPS